MLEVLGLKAASVGEIAAVLTSGGVSGYPPAITAARTVIVASLATLVLTLVIAFWRPRAYGRFAALLLLASSFAAMGGGEWVREDLRKPYVIGHYMFVNGARLAPEWTRAASATEMVVRDDRFDLAVLRRTGVLQSTPWARVPASPAISDSLSRLEAEGREVFRLSCTMCHTVDGYLTMRPLVAGRS